MGQIRECSDPSQNVLKSDLKSPGFVSFGNNLTHCGLRSDIQDETMYVLFSLSSHIGEGQVTEIDRKKQQQKTIIRKKNQEHLMIDGCVGLGNVTVSAVRLWSKQTMGDIEQV